MNSLSWLLYLADVASGLKAVLIVVMVISLTIVFFWFFTTEESQKNSKTAAKFMIGALVAAVIAAFLPSRETVYAIAASEMGEELLKTPTAAKATKALDAWLDKQITENTNQAPAAQ